MAELDRGQALLTLRLIWAALIVGQLVIAGVLIGLLGSRAVNPDPAFGRLLLIVSIAMLAALTPAGYFIRNQVYKRHWQNQAVTPEGYVSGNIILLAMMEGVSITAIIFGFIAGSVWPTMARSIRANTSDSMMRRWSSRSLRAWRSSSNTVR